MPEAPDPLLEQTLMEQRRQASVREESLGPLMAAAGTVRESCTTARLLLDELETSVGFHLEILDALLRAQLGNRWWQELRDAQARKETR